MHTFICISCFCAFVATSHRAPIRPPRPDPPVVRIALWAIAFRIVSALLAFASNVVFPDYQDQGFTMFGTPNLFWTRSPGTTRGGITRSRATDFITRPRGATLSRTFPVYPLLMRYVGRAFGRSPGDLFLGGIIVSWTAFVVSMVALYYLASLDLPRRRAECAALFIAIFPFAFFFGVVYSESTYLMFTVLAFYGFRTRRWIAGGLCGAFATASRVNGILMLPALAWIAWRTAERTPRDRALAAVGLVLVAVGVGSYPRCLSISSPTSRAAVTIRSSGRPRFGAGGTIRADRRGPRRFICSSAWPRTPIPISRAIASRRTTR